MGRLDQGAYARIVSERRNLKKLSDRVRCPLILPRISFVVVAMMIPKLMMAYSMLVKDLSATHVSRYGRKRELVSYAVPILALA
jgi:hypothetical protein